MTQRANMVATAIFTVVTALAVVVFDDFWRIAVVVVDVALFSVGVVTFILGYFGAVGRSRSEEISVAGVFLLTGSVAPPATRITMWTCLVVQIAVGLAGGILRSSTNGQAGSVLAFGVLVPMVGLGLNGWWASRHGSFPPRAGVNEATIDGDR